MHFSAKRGIAIACRLSVRGVIENMDFHGFRSFSTLRNETNVIIY